MSKFNWLSDQYLFFVLQAFVLLVATTAKWIDLLGAARAGKGGTTSTVKRGRESMAVFYGFYAVASGLLVALCLNVEVAKQYRVLWSVVDVLAVSYLCLRNFWFRNKLLGIQQALAELESR